MFWKRPKLPAEALPPLAPGERIVAWAPVDAGFLVATTAGLWTSPAERLGWHEISKAAWTGSTLTITPGPISAEDVIVDAPPVSWALPEPRDLPKQIQERVTRSVAYSSHHLLPGQPGGVRVLARRIPGRDGVLWVVRYDHGVDAQDAAVRLAVGELLERGQHEL